MFIDWSTAIAKSAGTAMLEVVGADPFRQPDWWLSASAGCGPNRPEARPWQRRKNFCLLRFPAGSKDKLTVGEKEIMKIAVAGGAIAPVLALQWLACCQ